MLLSSRLSPRSARRTLHAPRDAPAVVTSVSLGNLVPALLADVELPALHLENIYIRVGDNLDRHLGAELIPWTHSEFFRQNTTVRPVIMALFTPFSAMDWLTFNSSTLGIYGHAPFSAVSYNVSVTLVPTFVDTSEDITVPFNNTPTTFTAAAFSIFVLSQEPVNTDLKEWTPYLVIALIVIAIMGFAFALATCCWQDMCPSRAPCSSSPGKMMEEASNGDDADNKPTRNRSLKYIPNIDSTWSILGKSGHRQDYAQVTPYDVVAPVSPIPPRSNTHIVRKQRFIQEASTNMIIPENIGGLQHADITVGTSFAIKLGISCGSLRPLGEFPNLRAWTTRSAPEWTNFCPECMIVWGTVPEHLAMIGPPRFDIFVVSDSCAHALAKLCINILAQSRHANTEASPSYYQALSGSGEGVTFGMTNGVYIVTLAFGTTFCVRYHPPVCQGQLFRQDRYCFSSVQALPGWLRLNQPTLELVGNTSGYRRRDLRDIVVLDQQAKREVARLRIVLTAAEDKLGQE